MAKILHNADLEVLGTINVSTVSNATGDVIILDAFNQLAKRTYAEILTDIGGPFVDLVNDQSIAGVKTFTGSVITPTLQLSGGVGTQGTFSWNTDEETVDLIQDGTTLQLGQEIHYHARNNTGVTIPNGTAVMATGTLGASGRITIAPHNNDGTISPDYFIGITTEEILNGEDGKVTEFGKIRGLDTTGTPYGEVWADGDLIYLDPTTPGDLTNVQPPAIGGTVYKSPIAIVIHAHASTGTLFIRVQGNEGVHELHDVQLTATANNDVIRWVAANNRFENYSSTNWDTAFSWGDHAGLYVDFVSNQYAIGGEKTFTGAVQLFDGRVGVQTPVFGGSRLGDAGFQTPAIDTQAINFKDTGQLTGTAMFITPVGGSDGYTFTTKNFVDDVLVWSINGLGAATYGGVGREVESTLGLRNDFTGGQFTVLDMFNQDYDAATEVADSSGWVAIHGGGATAKEIGLWRYDTTTYTPIWELSPTNTWTFGTGVNVVFTEDAVVPDEVYGVGWDASLEVPTKNAVYDKIESLTLGSTTIDGLTDTTIGVPGNGEYLRYSTGTNTWENSSIQEADLPLLTDYALVAGDTFTGAVSVPDEAYGVGWNASLEVPTKNAVYDKIESIDPTGDYLLLSGASTMLGNLDMGGQWVEGVAQLRFTDADADTGIWSMLELTGAPYAGDLGIGHIGVFYYSLSQTGVPTQDNHLTDKLYVDGEISALTIPDNTDYVDLTTNQTVGGIKTFSGSMITNNISAAASVSIGSGAQAFADLWVDTIKLTDTDTVPSVPSEGWIYADASENRPKYYDGTSWLAFTLDGDAAAASHTHLLAAGATDVTATAAELNLLDLSGLTVGWVLSADSATTASWKAPTGGGGSIGGSITDNQIAVGATTADEIEGSANLTYDLTTLNVTGIVDATVGLESNYVSTDRGSSLSSDGMDVFSAVSAGGQSIMAVSNSTGSTGFPSATGQGLYVRGATSGRDMILWRTNTLGNNRAWIANKNAGNTAWEFNEIWHENSDGAGSGLDADLLDGLHRGSAGNYWDVVAFVASDGVMDIGRYIDFHESDADAGDFRLRLDAVSDNTLRLTASTTTSQYEAYINSADYGRLGANNSGGFISLGSSGLSNTFISSYGTSTFYGGDVLIANSNDFIVQGNNTTMGTMFWEVSTSNDANQRCDARAQGTGARLHWYGQNDSVTTGNTGVLWNMYDSGSYIQFNVLNDVVEYDTVNTNPLTFRLASQNDVTLKIEADTDNVDEGHNPLLILSQDGGVKTLDIGLTGAANVGLTGTAANDAYFKTQTTAEDIHFGGNTTRRLKIDNGNGDITAVDFVLSSDRRLKENIKDIIISDKSVSWKNFTLIDSDTGELKGGVIAQELEDVYPEYVRTNEEGIMSVAYTSLFASELAKKDKQVDELKNKVQTLEERIDRLETLLTIGLN